MCVPGASQRLLVIGGTGMLRRATIELCARGWAVTAVGREPRRLNELCREAKSSGGTLAPLVADWSRPSIFRRQLQAAGRTGGPFDAAIVWMHGERCDLLVDVAFQIRPEGVLLHVLGSAAADPLEAEFTRRLGEIAWPCHYRQVILGFMIEAGRSRWLTHEEISRGVVSAFDGDEVRSAVGVVEPWSMRPGASPLSGAAGR